jgi:hypothetical protein
VKPLFDHLIGKFSEAYVPEDQLSTDKSLIWHKGCLDWKVYIPKKRSQLERKIHGIETPCYSKLSKPVFALAEKFLNLG